MKIEKRNTTTSVEVQATDEVVLMGIDEAMMGHVMTVMTDMYSNPILAVIREYSTNAYDAQVEAGVYDPIQVTIDSDFFTVRDAGGGLNADDIRDTYSRYGTSTKRDSNDVVGMLGLGCKSALTYTDEFFVRSVKDGVCTQVNVGRDDTGAPFMVIVNEFKTNEPSGTEVSVPIKSTSDLKEFNETAANFYRFWDENTVEVNGESPVRIDGMWLNPKMLMTKGLDSNYIVMGNVAYPRPEWVASYNYATVHFVEIGDVNFTPSRESLQMNDKTTSAIKALDAKLRIERDAALLKLVEAAPSKYKALEVAREAKSAGLSVEPMYRGEKVPAFFDVPGEADMVAVCKAVKQHRRSGFSNERRLLANVVSEAHFVINHEKKFTGYKYEKVALWAKDKGLVSKDDLIVVINAETDMADALAWANPANVFDWAEVKKFKVVREATPRRDGRPTGSYEGYVNGAYVRVLQAEDINTDNPVLYLSKDESASMMEALREVHPDGFTIVTLGGNRINKFKRDFPTATHAMVYVRELATKWAATLTEDDLLSWHFNENHQGSLGALDADKIIDPALKKHITLSKSQVVKSHLRRWTTLREVKYVDPTKKYHLLGQVSYFNQDAKDHLYLYLNAAYTAAAEKGFNS